MNKQLKKLAEQAGLEELGDGDWCSLNHPDVRAEHLERFAELVRQDYLRELKALKPVGYMDSRGVLFNKTTHPQLNTPLYALDEPLAQSEQITTPISPDQYERFCGKCGACLGKPWVGLTDEEILDLWIANHKDTGATDAFARAIEAKLKEKNGAL